MKRVLWALTAACMLICAPALAQPRDSARLERVFNFGWRFQTGDPPGAQETQFDDHAWRRLDLPHDFQIEQPWDQAAGPARGFKTQGVGWYRKAFRADPTWNSKKVLLDFEGVMLFGEVWMNGQKVADIDYGYLGAEIDVTRSLRYDQDNLLAVRASTGKTGQSRWYTGGGLFRDVRLIVKNPISFAEDGVFITTPKISAERAEVAVQVEMDGLIGKRLDLEIAVSIYGPDGKLAGSVKAPGPTYSKATAVEMALPNATVLEPKLWSPDTPNLYTAKVTLSQKGQVLDETTETFGIRSVEFSKAFGLKLNGEKIFLKGASDHHDLGALGAAVHDRAIERLFVRLKQFGFNHVRLSHNPYSRSFLRLADKHGILIVDEMADKWSEEQYWPGAKPFTQMWYKIVPQWIKRDRNHPSVILWSLGNELQMRENFTGFPGANDWGVTTYRVLDVLAKRHDPTRPTTVAMFPTRAGAIGKTDPEFNTYLVPPELSEVTDVASFNYQFKAYPEYLKHAPNLNIYQSEAATSVLTGAYFGMDRDRMIGLAYWGAVEYWGESAGWPNKGWNFSFFNHALEPYPQAYLIKSAFVDAPLVHIGVVDGEAAAIEWNDVTVGRQPVSSHWNRVKNGRYNLFTYTNAEEVELLVNGRSLGVQRNPRQDPDRRNIIFWKAVPYGAGGEIVALARDGGRVVARHTLQTTGAPVALRIEHEAPDWKADGLDLAYITIRAVDRQGRIVPTAAADVSIHVAGAARLIALDNGDHATSDLFSGDRRGLHNGFAMAILRSEHRPGTVVVKASAPGLKPAERRLVTR